MLTQVFVLAVLAAGVLCISGWNLGLQQVVNPDEPRYACAARDMVVGTSNWVVPQFNGAPRLKKPILLYWLLALMGRVSLMIGENMVLGFRWVSVLAGLATILSAYGIGRVLYGTQVGILAGIILTTTPYFHMITREILIDPLFAGTLTASWLFFVLACRQLKEGEIPSKWLLAPLYLLLGLAGLAKGLPLVLAFGLIPMALCVFVARIWFPQKEYPSKSWPIIAQGFARMGFAWGIPLTILVSSAWFILLYQRGMLGETLQTLTSETLEKMTGDGSHTSSFKKLPLIYYLTTIASNCLPWSLLFLPTLWFAWVERKRISYETVLLLLAGMVPVVILGFFPSKRSLYMLPVFPFVAIGLAHVWHKSFVSEVMSRRFRLLWMGFLLLIQVVCAVMAWGVAFPQTSGLSDYMELANGEVAVAKFVGAVFVIFIALSLLAFMKSMRFRASLFALGSVWLGLWAYEAAIRPAEERQFNRTKIYSQIGKLLGPRRELLWLGGSSNEAVWYLDKTVRDIAAEDLTQELAPGQEAALMIRSRELSRIATSRLGQTRELGRWQIRKDEYVMLEPAVGSIGRTPKKGVED